MINWISSKRLQDFARLMAGLCANAYALGTVNPLPIVRKNARGAKVAFANYDGCKPHDWGTDHAGLFVGVSRDYDEFRNGRVAVEIMHDGKMIAFTVVSPATKRGDWYEEMKWPIRETALAHPPQRNEFKFKGKVEHVSWILSISLEVSSDFFVEGAEFAWLSWTLERIQEISSMSDAEVEKLDAWHHFVNAGMQVQRGYGCDTKVSFGAMRQVCRTYLPLIKKAQKDFQKSNEKAGVV